ncbi:hypothetical protein Vadar_029268 [Vaccinium darrowii]|uniref:Uncharacterized protein n=1 Tax=Vaccinium darrowii TaxID=229202 RepID=A0ACB7YIZ0_9ERIC|nr:hypothetical protein Vadar_029268 [Vaccinium darrowii]
MNAVVLDNVGRPVSLLLPPGTVIAAANTTVAMSAAAIVHEFAVSFLHFCPSTTNCLCSLVKTIAGVSA